MQTGTPAGPIADPSGNWSPDVDRLLTAVRRLQAVTAAARPDSGAALNAANLIDAVSDRLEHAIAENHSDSPRRAPIAPGRGQTLVPQIPQYTEDEEGVRGFVVFDAFYVGRGSVHGGAIGLFFDEMLGRVANDDGGLRYRTAYLTVNFRSPTPLDRVLQFDAAVQREPSVGRKKYVAGTLRDGEAVVADAEALFVELRSGQP